MKAKWILFPLGYLLFYLLVNFSFALPNEFNGVSISFLLKNSSRGSIWQIADVTLWFVVSLLPYFILLLFYQHKKIFCLLLLTISVPFTFLVRFFAERIMTGYPIELNVYLFKNSYFLICFNLYPIIFFFIQYAQYKTLQAKELMIANRESEISFLRSQINPHFLFNSLNNIYSLVYDNSVHALSAISELSDILRYMLYDTGNSIPLQKEIDYINKYISLQQLRCDHPLNIKMQVNTNGTAANFPPLLFLPFVENAFKHGELQEDNALEIDIQTTGKETFFHCRNKKSTNKKDTGSGIGLNNVRRRLELLYAGKHVLNIKNDAEYFDVSLTIFQ